MAVVVNNPSTERSGNSGLITAVLLLIALALVLFYGIPAIGRSFSGPTYSVPSKIDVNVSNPQQ